MVLVVNNVLQELTVKLEVVVAHSVQRGHTLMQVVSRPAPLALLVSLIPVVAAATGRRVDPKSGEPSVLLDTIL